MKKLLLSAALLAGTFSANAQLPDGSVAPDFTLTDINGNTQHLYAMLDAGYTVFIDVSATWCGPCWNYHNTNALEDLWTAHGPAGGTNVVAGTTDNVMVLYIEGDGTTNSADLNGSGTNTQGDWVTGVSHPIIDPVASAINAFNSAYGIGYFPTIYKICPNRILVEAGQASAAALYASVAACPPPASNPADAAALSFDSDLVVCGGNYTPIVTIQNNGTTAMTSATVTVMNGATVVSTGSYSGNLATYGTAQVTCTAIAGFTGGTLTVTVTTASDANAGNGNTSGVISNAIQASGATGTVAIVTDAYGSETTWNIKNASGTVIASGGPYNDLAAAGTTVQTVVNFNMVSNMCYTFNIIDSYGDGINTTYGAGSYTVKDATNATIASGGNFLSLETKAFKSGVLGINELAIEGLNIYPNPASDVLNVSFEAVNGDYVVTMLDLQGRVVATQNHTSLNGAQTLSIPVSEFAKGSYIVTISTNGVSTSQNVIIK